VATHAQKSHFLLEPAPFKFRESFMSQGKRAHLYVAACVKRYKHMKGLKKIYIIFFIYIKFGSFDIINYFDKINICHN